MTLSILPQPLKFVTGNINKVREAGTILGIQVEQVVLHDLYEVQTSDLRDLVRHKLLQAHTALQEPVMVEDSGLLFSAWNGLPGALVKWFEAAVSCEGMLKMLEPFADRGASAVCYVALHDGKNIHIAKGEVRGSIADRIRGNDGFGWDVIFIPEGHDRTFAEMSAEEKNAISHRSRAFERLKILLAGDE